MYETSSDTDKLFNRTFDYSHYYHCHTTTNFWFENNITNSSGPCFKIEKKDDKVTVCSYMQLSDSVIFPGDLENNTHVKCMLEIFAVTYQNASQLGLSGELCCE